MNRDESGFSVVVGLDSTTTDGSLSTLLVMDSCDEQPDTHKHRKTIRQVVNRILLFIMIYAPGEYNNNSQK